MWFYLFTIYATIEMSDSNNYFIEFAQNAGLLVMLTLSFSFLMNWLKQRPSWLNRLLYSTVFSAFAIPFYFNNHVCNFRLEQPLLFNQMMSARRIVCAFFPRAMPQPVPICREAELFQAFSLYPFVLWPWQPKLPTATDH